MANNSTTPFPCSQHKITDGPYLEQTNENIFKTIFMPSFIFTVVMFLIGGIGNALVFYIYFAKWRKTTARIFILALAGFDLINCFLTMPMELAVLKYIIKFDSGITCKLFRYTTFMMNNGSSVILAGIAVDRYIRICMPLRPQLRTKHAKIVVVIALILSVVFAWPALVLYGTQSVFIPVPSNIGICIVGKTCLYEMSYLHTDYPLMFTLVLLIGNVIIDTGLITCYMLIGYQVVKRGNAIDPGSSIKMRKASTSTVTTDDDHLKAGVNEILPLNSPENSVDVNDKCEDRDMAGKSKRKLVKQTSVSKKRDVFRQRSLSISSIEARKSQMYKTTFMLFMVTILFMTSFIPYCVIVIIRALNKSHYDSLSSTGKAIYNLFLRTYMLSSSLNPIIYCFMSVQFRQKIKETFNEVTRYFRRD